MSSDALRSWLVVVVGAAAVTLPPAPTLACGGCFHDPTPTGSPMVVDAHRMVLVVSPSGTMLWDQIVYEGDPTEFVWVLPVAPGTAVELADNGFFEALTDFTRIDMLGPPPIRTFCDDPCGGGLSGGFFGAGAPSEVDAGAGVRVEHQGVIGPYETATIGSEDPGALLVWMNDHGYVVDDAILPTLDHYVAQGLSFAVLRLRSSAAVDRMQPVRVGFPGVSPTLPLRMVAAGVGIDLDLELFVFAEARMEASSYGNAEVDRAAITYDWADGTFDYERRFDEALFAGDGPGANWVTEYAQPFAAWWTLQNFRRVRPDGTESSAAADSAVVRAALPGDAYLTRLRTRVRANDLREDLTLRASSLGEVGTFIQVTREANRPWEPTCSTFCASGNGIEPGGSVGRGGGSLRGCPPCSHVQSSRSGNTRALLGLAALTVACARRRVRSRASR